MIFNRAITGKAEDIRRGPGNYGVILREMFEKGEIPSCEVLFADFKIVREIKK